VRSAIAGNGVGQSTGREATALVTLSPQRYADHAAAVQSSPIPARLARWRRPCRRRRRSVRRHRYVVVGQTLPLIPPSRHIIDCGVVYRRLSHRTRREVVTTPKPYFSEVETIPRALTLACRERAAVALRRRVEGLGLAPSATRGGPLVGGSWWGASDDRGHRRVSWRFMCTVHRYRPGRPGRPFLVQVPRASRHAPRWRRHRRLPERGTSRRPAFHRPPGWMHCPSRLSRPSPKTASDPLSSSRVSLHRQGITLLRRIAELRPPWSQPLHRGQRHISRRAPGRGGELPSLLFVR
jgi:hypothetical protein